MKVPALAFFSLAIATANLGQEGKSPDYASTPLPNWIEALKNGDDRDRHFQAREALGPNGPYAKVAVPALIDAFKDTDWKIYGEPARTLSSYGLAVVASLTKALTRPEASVRAGAAETLGLVSPKPKDAIPALIEAGKDADADVRTQAIFSLGVIGRGVPKAMHSVITALQDRDAAVRRRAADVLADWGTASKPAVPALISTLNDTDELVRAFAAGALSRIGPEAKAAVPALLQALRDNATSRAEFIGALGAIGPAAKEAVPAIQDALRDRELHKPAARALGKIGVVAKPAVAALIEVAKDARSEGREDAIEALGLIGPDARAAVPVLLEALEVKSPIMFRYTVAEALGRIGPEAKAAAPKLIAIAQDKLGDEGVRKAACEAVVKIDPVTAGKLNIATAYLSVRLGKVPMLKPLPRPALCEAEKKQIKTLIGQLAEIDTPDFGISATFSGHAFAALPDREHWSTMLLTDHQVKRSDALRRLVEKGPDALPYLLEALDNKTPTKLKVAHNFAIGFMGFGSELSVNPLNPAEETRPPKERPDEDDEDIQLDPYTVPVGDICFVAIGQIVGRSYQAVRYQPTAIIILNSPAHRKEFRECIRGIWSSMDSAKKLLDSLLLDYATEGIFNGSSLDGWALGSELQVESAMRLLYYFPVESAPMIAERLKRMDVRNPKPGNGSSMKREVANGARTTDLLKAINWCKEPLIREALFEIFERTDDAYVVSAVLPALKEIRAERIMPHLQAMLKKLPASEDDVCGDGYELLGALGQHSGKLAKPEFERYLLDASLQRRWTMCKVLQETQPHWALELLAPMLSDKRTGYGGLADRLCDTAARALSQIYPELKFDWHGSYDELDRRIEELRKQIARKKK